MSGYRDEPWYLLARHFFAAQFDLGFLSDAAAESLKRMIIGVAAALFGIGLVILRMFAAKYAYLASRASPEPYLSAVAADHAFLIAIPMWVVAVVAVLVGHSLFPDETDFRVLMGLPITRRLVFGAKLLAVALFTGLFVAAAHVAVAPVFVVTSVGPWAQPFWLQLPVYLAATLAASAFALLAITAIHGLLILWAPRGQLIAISTAVRSLLVCALVLSLPLVARLPAQSKTLAGDSWWLLAPPVWFAGLECWLLGDAHANLARLAWIGVAATALAFVVSTASYIVLYRRFDRVILRPASASTGAPRRWRLTVARWADPARPVSLAIRTFTAITLRRSVMHQGVLVALSTVAGGIAVNALVAAVPTGWHMSSVTSARLASTSLWAPFVLMFVICLAARLAIALPLELRANWVFRMTEDDADRPDQMNAAAHVVWRVGVAAPVLVMLPVQWMSLGPRAIVAAAITLLAGAIFVELMMRDWARIPFTCSYAPGKRFVPQSLLIGFLTFVLFSTIGTTMVRIGLESRVGAVVVMVLLAAALLLLRRHRVRYNRHTPLTFEDQLPTEINPLRLSGD